MKSIPEPIYQIVCDYISALQSKLSVEKVFLFEDYGPGVYKSENEINIAVVSTFFNDIPRVTAVKLLFEIASRFPGHNLVLYPLTDRDYREQTGFAAFILENSIEFYNQEGGFLYIGTKELDHMQT